MIQHETIEQGTEVTFLRPDGSVCVGKYVKIWGSQFQNKIYPFSRLLLEDDNGFAKMRLRKEVEFKGIDYL